MKLFYQLSSTEQDEAINHCADLVISNAVENGLQLEVEDETGLELKKSIDDLFVQLKKKDFKSKDQKIKFLMNEEAFSDTVLDLASEMAYNAFYHESNELVIFTEALSGDDSEFPDDDDSDEDDSDIDEPQSAEDLTKYLAKKKSMLN